MTGHDNRARLLACALAFQAGFVDALGFIHLKGYFVSFMSGNSTRLGVGLAQHEPLALVPAVLIAVFVSGVVMGSSVRRLALSTPAFSVLALVALGLLGAATCFHAGFEQTAILLMALSMGAENAALERSGQASLGVTYVTGALVKVGQQIAEALFGGDRWSWLWNALLWASLVLGAFTGATSYRAWSLDSLWISTVVALCLAGIVRISGFDRRSAS